MKRMLLLIALAAFLVPATWNQVIAQHKVEVRNFHGTVVQKQKIALAWWAQGDTYFTSQIIEWSMDGNSFKPIAEIPVQHGAEGYLYQYLHETPVIGVNYYRLVLLFSDGEQMHSEMIKVNVTAAPIFTYPNRPRPGSTPRI